MYGIKPPRMLIPARRDCRLIAVEAVSRKRDRRERQALVHLRRDQPLMTNLIESQMPPGKRRSFFGFLGPGLITGAADDDPSGVATYSQAGAQFGLGLAWTMLFTFPLLACIQEISARIGRTTGQGIAGNLRDFYPRPLLIATVGLLTIANTINLGADLGAMGEALKLLMGGAGHIYVVGFGFFCATVQISVPYARYVYFLKWLTLSLLAYVATLVVVEVPWTNVLLRAFVPTPTLERDYLIGVVAVFGTTIAPYLIFWQAAEEVDEVALRPASHALIIRPDEAPDEIRRIRLDTYFGIGFSNLVGLCIIITTALTLNASGVTNIETAAQAAEALRPIAGPFCLHGLRGWNHRHRPAGRTGPCWVFGLCHWGISQPASGSRPQAARSIDILWHHRRLDADRCRHSFQPDRSHQGTVLERRHQRHHLGADHDGHHARCRAAARHGPFCPAGIFALGRLDLDGHYGDRRFRHVGDYSDMIIGSQDAPEHGAKSTGCGRSHDRERSRRSSDTLMLKPDHPWQVQ